MKEYNFAEFTVKKMNRNSLTVENKRTREECYIARRVFNALIQNPELPVFTVRKDFKGIQMNWLATPMTF